MSFHGLTIVATKNDLVNTFGYPQYGGTPDDKVQNEWELKTPDGIEFSIYDWKEYYEFSDTKKICWHIGHENREDCHAISQYLKQTIKKA